MLVDGDVIALVAGSRESEYEGWLGSEPMR
jgi:hypothetical protein